MSAIHLLYAGGTFGCYGNPLQPLPAEVFLPMLQPLTAQHTIHQLDNPIVKDSSHLTPMDFVHFYRLIWQAHQDGAERFLVITGTDTLSYLAAFLGYALSELAISVVITGGMLPLLSDNPTAHTINSDSDALINFAHALTWLDKSSYGVTVSFGNKILSADSIQKIDSQAINAFSGTEFTHSCTTDNKLFHPNFELIDHHLTKYSHIHTLYLVPNQPEWLASQLQALLNKPPTAVIIIAFGVGNLPDTPAIRAAIEQLSHADFMVVIASSSPFGSRSASYAAGSWQYACGALPSKALPMPAIYAKLLWLCLSLPPNERQAAWLNFINTSS
ncbi:MAG: asparaginase domain-containing protein [Moraxella sp.]|nr:asparaginase domain-containing protein [Moraxella sp.]